MSNEVVSTENNSGIIQGFPLTRNCPPLTHILFADDTLLFGRASADEARVLKELLVNFSAFSGQDINFHKSSICFSKWENAENKALISEILGMQSMKEDDKYLGLPSFWGKSKREALNFIYERMWNKAQGWKQKLLSNAGREVLIKSVLASIPCFTMQCLLLPVTFVNKLNGLIAKFWWSGDVDNRKIHWLNWDKLTSSKHSGGLGFKDLKIFNIALLAKQVWRLFTNQNSMCYKILKGLYFPHEDILHASRSRRPSWIWSSLYKGKEALLTGLISKIGNGVSTNIWRDSWVPSLPMSKPLNRSIAHHTFVSVSELIYLSTKSWRWDLLQMLFSADEQLAIGKIHIGHYDTPDRLVWRHKINGVFTVKSGYHAFKAQHDLRYNANRASSSYAPFDPGIWKQVWHTKAPPKIKHFIWKLFNEALPTAASLHRRHLNSSPICCVCHASNESILHMLFECPHARATWLACSLGFKFDPMICTSFGNWMQSVFALQDQANTQDIASLAMHICWGIWLARNRLLFDNEIPCPAQTAKQASEFNLEFLQVPRNFVLPDALDRSNQTSWMPPPEGDVKLNCDGSWCDDISTSGIAAIVRNHKGQLMYGQVKTLCAGSALEAELRAIQMALKIVRDDYAQVKSTIESDCYIATILLNIPKPHLDWQIENFVLDLRLEFEKLPLCSIMYVPRACNRLADWCCKQARLASLPGDWATSHPSELDELLYSDFPS